MNSSASDNKLFFLNLFSIVILTFYQSSGSKHSLIRYFTTFHQSAFHCDNL